MTALEHARAAYGAAGRFIRTERDTEFAVLGRMTRQLKVATEAGSAYPDLAAALHDNRILWGAFALDLADPGNGLPRDLRASLLSLARFVEQQTSRVLRGSGTPDVLIEINSSVMQGLRAAEGNP